jgi:mechanosensitive ion channel-like protein
MLLAQTVTTTTGPNGQAVWLWVQSRIPGGVVGAIIILIVGWLIARLLEAIVTAALRRTGLDRRLAPMVTDARPAAPPTDVAASIGRFVYYVAMLFVLVAVFDALGLTIVTTPLTALLAELFAFLPRLVAAILIVLVGWLLARIVSRLVSGLLAAMGLDRHAERWGLAGGLGGQRLSGIIGTIVYVLILLPVIAAALDALQLEALTRPISNMINEILAAVPNVVAAVLVVAIAYVVGRLVADLITALLTGLGVNALPARLGLGGPTPVRPAAAMTDRTTAVPATTVGGRTPAQLIGWLVQVAIVWFAVIQAFQILGFTQLTGILTDLLALAGRILLGLIIFLVGLWLAQLAAGAIRTSGVGQPALLAVLARGAILVLSGAMALRQMGVAN